MRFDAKPPTDTERSPGRDPESASPRSPSSRIRAWTRRFRLGLLTIALLVLSIAVVRSDAAEDPDPSAGEPVLEPSREVADFLLLLGGSPGQRQAALDRVASQWHASSPVMLLETLYFLREPRTAEAALDLLRHKTGEDFGFGIQQWYEWIWAQKDEAHPAYPTFKSELYGKIDPKFAGYFSADHPSRIRLDEIRWGGVVQDGIPPLRAPRMIEAKKAKYLADTDVVFGIEVDGEPRAYPKRILGWHEMFVDEIRGVPVAGVYCTLCGTVILYDTEVDGVTHEMGTSGFLYRSNKLMYDQATQSLWNTFTGEPVVGPLVGKGIRLGRRSVVTTSWGEWRRRHPRTRVLSLDTGYERDYGEGAAYREYFATDDLMFNVPKLDRRLRNKAEVLALTFPEHPQSQLAIAQEFLEKNAVYHDAIGDIEFVVLTDRTGANRVYASAGVRFESWDQDQEAKASDGTTWSLSESALSSGDGRKLVRLPSQRAFWFGWQAAHPDTRLVR